MNLDWEDLPIPEAKKVFGVGPRRLRLGAGFCEAEAEYDEDGEHLHKRLGTICGCFRVFDSYFLGRHPSGF